MSDMSKNIEEYLETLYKLDHNGKNISTSAIAKSLNIAPASVTQMLKKLNKMGYVYYSPYKGVSLTDKGLALAKKITRRHRLLERFLYDILKIKKDRVHQQACEMEHSLSDEVERALCQLLEAPDKCPDDFEPIPECNLKFSNCEECLEKAKKDIDEIGVRKKNSFSLIDLKEGDVGKVVFIRGNHKIIRRLLDMGITPSTLVKIIKIAPLGGPVEISVRGSNLALGRSIASNVFVEPI